MTRIAISEEYGYRNWLWTHPGSAEDVLADWAALRAPLDFFDPSIPIPGYEYRGTMEPLDLDDETATADGHAHVHEWDDTYLVLGGRVYQRGDAEGRPVPLEVP